MVSGLCIFTDGPTSLFNAFDQLVLTPLQHCAQNFQLAGLQRCKLHNNLQLKEPQKQYPVTANEFNWIDAKSVSIRSAPY